VGLLIKIGNGKDNVGALIIALVDGGASNQNDIPGILDAKSKRYIMVS
jgi:hypothetical protein